MNTYNIEEKDLGIVGSVNNISVTLRTYVMGSDSVRVMVFLNNGSNTVFSKELTVPAEVVAQWGTDDTVIIDWVCTELGLTLA